MKPYPNDELERMSKREIIRLYKRTVEQFNDAVPVVRCKDCIRYREYTYLGTQKVYVCERDYRKRIYDMKEDDFCSKAERGKNERV